jgi:hypothetical protein
MSNAALETSTSAMIDAKFTAALIETSCPVRLQQIGKEIGKRLERARKQHQLAEDHLIAVNKLIAEAKALCDGGGFDKFRELFCPQLGKSQAYAMLAIAAGKKTLAEHRTAERKRKQKSRANQRVVTANSGTVPEGSKPQEVPANEGAVQVTSTATEQMPKVAKPRGTVAPCDEALRAFTMQVMDLDRRTAKRPPARFSKTAVPAEVLARLGKLLTDVAASKGTSAEKRALMAASEDATARSLQT